MMPCSVLIALQPILMTASSLFLVSKKSRINRRAFVNLVDLLFGLNMSVRSAVIRLMTLSQRFYLGRGGRKKAQKTYCSFVIVRADSRRRSRDTAF